MYEAHVEVFLPQKMKMFTVQVAKEEKHQQHVKGKTNSLNCSFLPLEGIA